MPKYFSWQKERFIPASSAVRVCPQAPFLLRGRIFLQCAFRAATSNHNSNLYMRQQFNWQSTSLPNWLLRDRAPSVAPFAGIAQRQSNCLVSSRSGYRNSLPAPSECSSVWLEHLIAIQKVAGSSPVIPSIGSQTSIKSHQDNRKSQQWNTRRNNSVIKFVQSIEITCD